MIEVNRVYVDAEGVVRMSPTGWPNLPVKILTDRHSTYVRDLEKAKEESIPFEDNIGALFLIAGYFVKNEKVRGDVHKNTFYTIEPIQVELVEVHDFEKDCSTNSFYNTMKVARIVTEEEKPADQRPTINDTYWTAMLTLSARIPKGASLLLAYETDQAICVTNSKTPEHHSCTEMGCINDSHVIYRLPKVEYAPKAPLDQPSTPEEKEKAFEGIEPGLLDQPIRFPQPEVDKPRCECELFVEKYYGLNPCPPINGRINTDYGDLVNLLAMFRDELKQQPTEWIPVSERPLYITTEKGWEVTKDGEGEFWAAVPISDNTWWIKHCVVEDEIGLCVVCNDDTETAGFTLEDVTHFIPISLPEPPKP